MENKIKNPRNIKCAVCGEMTTLKSIGMHVKKYHGLDGREYKVKHGLEKSDEQLLEDKIDRSIKLSIDSMLNPITYKDTMDDCSGISEEQQLLAHGLLKHCVVITDKGRVNIKSNKRYICRVIRHWSHLELPELILKYESIIEYYKTADNYESYEYYMTMFNDDEYARSKINYKSDRVAGDKNPAYQHGGKFSPFSKKFIHHDETKRQETLKKAADNREYTTHESYYTNRGMTDEEARKALSERQNTNGLDKYVERFGTERGFELWVERNRKWQETLNNKSDDEKRLINSKKRADTTFTESHNLHDEPAVIYFIELECLETNTVFYKIGATTQTLKDRFSNLPTLNLKIKNVLAVSKEFPAIRVQTIENKLHEFCVNNYGIVDIGRTFEGWTECHIMTQSQVEKIKAGILNLK